MILKHKRGYVWVFTSFREVAYFYTETREGEFVEKTLNDFKGVLVSDFYAPYDALACSHQKCLLHLMRDLNDAILDHPYDAELKKIATGFGSLLRSIVETIDRWGLKRRYLRKHAADLDRFYRKITRVPCVSEASQKCVERFVKNREGLFTFLNFDGVPWNNNNAEHAVKAFARLRRAIVGLSTAKGIDEYLVLLSICQTCKYSGLDFLDFLRSGEKDIDAFASRHGRARPAPGATSPDGEWTRFLFHTKRGGETAPVFVVATANDVTQLPAEMLRKGRWDELFFVDLPSQPEREAIWKIQIALRGRKPKELDTPQLAKATDGLTGSEIEAVFVEALYQAFNDGEEPTDLAIAGVLADFVPLSKTMAEQIAGLRSWAKGRARPAASAVVAEPKLRRLAA